VFSNEIFIVLLKLKYEVEELLGKYIKQLQTLNGASNKILGKAPRKPILLLSVCS
jgi:hypothetical protein